MQISDVINSATAIAAVIAVIITFRLGNRSLAESRRASEDTEKALLAGEQATAQQRESAMLSVWSDRFDNVINSATDVLVTQAEFMAAMHPYWKEPGQYDLTYEMAVHRTIEQLQSHIQTLGIRLAMIESGNFGSRIDLTDEATRVLDSAKFVHGSMMIFYHVLLGGADLVKAEASETFDECLRVASLGLDRATSVKFRQTILRESVAEFVERQPESSKLAEKFLSRSKSAFDENLILLSKKFREELSGQFHPIS